MGATFENFNYTIVVVFLSLGIASVYWYSVGRYHFKGPPIDVKEQYSINNN